MHETPPKITITCKEWAMWHGHCPAPARFAVLMVCDGSASLPAYRVLSVMGRSILPVQRNKIQNDKYCVEKYNF